MVCSFISEINVVLLFTVLVTLSHMSDDRFIQRRSDKSNIKDVNIDWMLKSVKGDWSDRPSDRRNT